MEVVSAVVGSLTLGWSGTVKSKCVALFHGFNVSYLLALWDRKCFSVKKCTIVTLVFCPANTYMYVSSCSDEEIAAYLIRW